MTLRVHRCRLQQTTNFMLQSRGGAFQLLEPLFKIGDAAIERSNDGGEVVGDGWRRGEWGRDADGIAEQMGEASFARAGLAGKKKDEWAIRRGGLDGRGAGGETIESGGNRGEVVEGEEAIGARAEFAGGLRATENEKAKKGGLVAAEIEDSAGVVLVFGYARACAGEATASWGGEAAILEGMEGLAENLFGEIEDGIARGPLVGGGLQGVERERVDVGRGDLFFNQDAEHAEFAGGELHEV